MDGSTLTECLNESERKRGLWSENLGRLLASLFMPALLLIISIVQARRAYKKINAGKRTK